MSQPNQDQPELPGHLDGVLEPAAPAPDPGVPLVDQQAPPQQGSWTDYQLGLITGSQQPQPPMMNGPAGILMSGGYRVLPEEAPRVIANHRAAADALRNKAASAERLRDIPSPGLDAVSRNAVRVIGEAAAGPRGSLRLALQAAAEEVDQQANELQAQLMTYLGVEDANSLDLPPPDPLGL